MTINLILIIINISGTIIYCYESSTKVNEEEAKPILKVVIIVGHIFLNLNGITLGLRFNLF